MDTTGRARTDILFAPSNDWAEVKATHASMAIMRAIEQGFTLVRPKTDGFSLVTDPLGRTVAWQDTDQPGEHALVANVPTDGVLTMYSVIGDLFSWACIAVFLASLGVGIARTRRDASALEIAKTM